jgi:D-alanyl-D-alanine carboxypeptidase
MKFLSELFDGGTNATQKKKKITFYCICVTLALIAVMLLILAAFGVAKLVGDLVEAEAQSTPSVQVSIGNTETTTLDASGVHLGNLLILDSAHRYGGDPNTVIIRNYEGRPKTKTGSNVYSVAPKGASEELDFRGSPEAVGAFNLMMADFYAANGDDNICITNAYTLASKNSIDAVFSAATTFELGYYFEFPGEVRSIYGVEKYEWIYTNAYKYGFINLENTDASEEGESDIFRYVGVSHATYMKTKRLTLDAYLEQLRSATPDLPLLTKVGKITYASYYLAADGEHRVPTEHEYTVSGNNTDGYIVTVSIAKTAAKSTES